MSATFSHEMLMYFIEISIEILLKDSNSNKGECEIDAWA